MDNIADYFYNELDDSADAGKLLTTMVFQIFDVDSVKYYRRVVQAVNKAIKIYGKYKVFWAILSMSSMDNIDFNTYLYPLISSIILKTLKAEGKATGQCVTIDFNKEAVRLEKKINETKNANLTIERPLDE